MSEEQKPKTLQDLTVADLYELFYGESTRLAQLQTQAQQTAQAVQAISNEIEKRKK